MSIRGAFAAFSSLLVCPNSLLGSSSCKLLDRVSSPRETRALVDKGSSAPK
jgi:hypothetical protein